jgi:uncharacterized membrane protein YdbT with pleckstrin-like domain
MADSNDRYEQARAIAQRKVAFIRHAIVYLLVMAVLAIINNVTWGGYQWWMWPALGWGIGVVAHFLSAYLFQTGGMVDRMAKRELERMGGDEKK